jgi:hypothetical protein
MNKTTMVMETYEAPKAEVIEVVVEKGFAVSAEPLRKADDEIDW